MKHLALCLLLIAFALAISCPCLALAPAGDKVDVAVAQANALHRPLVIQFGAEWCPACKRLQVWEAEPEHARVLTGSVVFLYLDVDRDRILIERHAGLGLPANGFLPRTHYWRWDGQRLGAARLMETREFMGLGSAR